MYSEVHNLKRQLTHEDVHIHTKFKSPPHCSNEGTSYYCYTGHPQKDSIEIGFESDYVIMCIG